MRWRPVDEVERVDLGARKLESGEEEVRRDGGINAGGEAEEN